MSSRALSLSLVFVVAAALAACNANAPPPIANAPQQPVAYMTPSDFKLPAGAGCSGDIARWQAVQENDHRMGQVDDHVYGAIQGEIAQAASVCQVGHDGEARALVEASKRRHGYPG